jgi:diphthamide biosynthesis protein 2
MTSHIHLRATDTSKPLQVYLLADTTFCSLSVDEVAAEHAKADCIIHYGHATLSSNNRIPTHFVFPRASASVARICSSIEDHLAETSSNQMPLIVLLDLVYMHLREEIVAAIKVRRVSRSGRLLS